MAESEYESKLDEIERGNLQKAISEVEAAIAASTPASRSFFENFLQNAKGRLGTLDKKIKDADKAREEHTREQLVLTMAENEKALSAQEREQFSGFLGKDFFTKADFGALEQFYAKSWDRLSEKGKDAMSHRIWEGIRHKEFEFSDLPKAVQEKEAKRAYSVLTKRESGVGASDSIPAADREDFIRAYESGKQDEASKVLERRSFKDSMFRGNDSAARSHSAADRSGDLSKTNALAKADAAAAPDNSKQETPAAIKNAAADLSALGLDGIKLVDAKSQGTSAEIPNGKTVALVERQSTRGS